MDYPIGENEVLRVAALRALKIVGTPPTAAFDSIAQLAAETFGCPIAFVSLLDDNEQWFKAECGLNKPIHVAGHRLLQLHHPGH